MLSVGIVGSRRATIYGLHTAENFAFRLAEYNITVVSGLARGIDTAAHRGALKAKGRTIGVLGCGLNIVYPAENRMLYAEIENSGAVISEYPMDAPPARDNFPRRNRIISGLSMGVVVVEAAERSGALITANLALEQGREVFAVPGHIGSFTSAGTHKLLKDGAAIVTTADDVIEAILPQAKIAVKQKEKFAERIQETINSLTNEEKAVYKSIQTEPKNLDEIAADSGIPLDDLYKILTNLEIKRAVKKMPGNMYESTNKR